MQENKQKDKDKTVKIVINGAEKTVEKGELSYDEVVALAFDNPPTGENILITITYRRGQGNKPEGSLKPSSEPVKVKEGMIFDVTATDKS